MDIVKSDPPKQFIKLGYFEAFNLNRECLNMDVRQIDSSYTHVHFAFAMLKDDFTVYLEDEYQKYQFEQFKKLKGPKRIISFGGWTFSAERPYYTIFRNGVKTANRNTLATNIAKFINDNGLDGVDIDVCTSSLSRINAISAFWLPNFDGTANLHLVGISWSTRHSRYPTDGRPK